jgi:hypothetical protein
LHKLGESDSVWTFAVAQLFQINGLNFTSSLFEGKGTEDESWGLDNVGVSTASLPGVTETPPGQYQFNDPQATNYTRRVGGSSKGDLLRVQKETAISRR